ncbi:MAG: isoleucine--tRNA ligase [Coxiella sp. (in: Bacteria)]|nr:MAG: isoleucine--tRNA ligase [Coxiella sp. (in: g-proteobacteria)]
MRPSYRLDLYPAAEGNVSSAIVSGETALLEQWKSEAIFQKSIDQRRQSEPFVFYDGPPFATGLPHYGHALAGIIKDAIPRYQTMQGKRVERNFGWDCHGVPVEYQIEKERKLHGHKDIRAMGIKAFNGACRDIVMKYTTEWRSFVERSGRFIDMENDYKTMDRDFMDSVWSVFGMLDAKKFVYEGKKIVAFSAGLGTPLSNFEVEQNYQDTMDPSLTVSFPLQDDPNTILLVWTTTPWTLPTNVAIAVNPAVEYVAVQREDKRYIVAKKLASEYFEVAECAAAEVVDINTLVGKKYVPIFRVPAAESEASYQVLVCGHASDEAGTGLVHTSPAFGEDDYHLGQEHRLPAIDLLNENGKFQKDAEVYSNDEKIVLADMLFKDADNPLTAAMQKAGRAFRVSEAEHRYPFCPRTETPLFYRAIPTWYLKVTAVKENLIANNNKITWSPEFVGSERFGNWLEQTRDWAVSRNRYWGCPIPIWRNVEDSNDWFVVSSRADLERLAGTGELHDLHRDFIDQLTIEKDGKTYQRVSEVFDCWFESGAMPYAEKHFPRELSEKELLETRLPADFIAEGLDQTRGWFYTLLVLSTMLFNRPPFKHCVVTGILLGNDGKKMSKSIGNYEPIDDVFEKYGADALRFVLLNSPATRAESFSVTDVILREAVSRFLIPIQNLYHFFAEKANLFGFKPVTLERLDTLSGLDMWMLYLIEQYKITCTEAYDNYDMAAVCKASLSLIEGFSGWYVRNIKHAFKNENSVLMKSHLNVLHYCLEAVAHTMAPITPFIADQLYQQLGLSQFYGYQESVHLQRMPQAKPVAQYEASFRQGNLIRMVVQMANKIREEQQIRLRQPLAKLTISAALMERLDEYWLGMLKQEANVKEVICTDQRLDESSIEWSIELNCRALGPKLKKRFSALQTAVAEKAFDLSKDRGTLTVGDIVITKKSGDFYVVAVETPRPNVKQSKEAGITIELDLALTAELMKEGEVRDLQHAMQDLRKAAQCQTTDNITIFLPAEICQLMKNLQQAGDVGSPYLVFESKQQRIKSLDASQLEQSQVDAAAAKEVDEQHRIVSFKLNRKEYTAVVVVTPEVTVSATATQRVGAPRRVLSASPREGGERVTFL